MNFSGSEVAQLTIRFKVKNQAGKLIYHSDHIVSSFTDSILGVTGTFLPAAISKTIRIAVKYPADKYGPGNVNTMAIISAKVFAKPDLKVPSHLFSFIRTQPTNELVSRFTADPSLSRVRSGNGWTPVLAAAECDSPALLKLLVKQGCKLNTRTKSGMGVMQYVALSGSESTLDYLLRAGFKINDRGGDGRTALHHAAAHSPEAVDPLIRKGADINAKDKAGERPIAKAAWNMISPVVDLLVKRKASLANDSPSGMGPLQISARLGDVESIKVYAAAGVNLNTASKPTLRTALHVAIEEQQGQAIRWLLSYGANLYAKDSKGVTPYDIAMKLGGKPYAEMLLNTSKRAAEMRRNGR